MKKTSFLKKLTAMAATLAMTCVMAVGAFAAEPAVDYKLDSAAINVGETWTMSVPAGGMYDWNLSSEYIAYGPSMADKGACSSRSATRPRTALARSPMRP